MFNDTLHATLPSRADACTFGGLIDVHCLGVCKGYSALGGEPHIIDLSLIVQGVGRHNGRAELAPNLGHQVPALRKNKIVSFATMRSRSFYVDGCAADNQLRPCKQDVSCDESTLEMTEETIAASSCQSWMSARQIRQNVFFEPSTTLRSACYCL